MPVVLGCCPPGAERCRLCAPSKPVLPATIRALIASTQRDHPDTGLRVQFYGGAAPSDAQLDAIGDVPFGCRLRPDAFTWSTWDRLRERGLQHLELDALSLHERSLKAIDRPYSAALIPKILQAVQGHLPEVGVVLAVGLPHSDHGSVLKDVAAVLPHVQTLRLHPVLVLEGSALRMDHANGRYVPLTIAQAVTTCAAACDLAEAADVRVIRIGQQPRIDGLGHAVAGPRHSGLGELVAARRTQQAVMGLTMTAPRTGAVRLRCHPADVSRTRGPLNANTRAYRAALQGRLTGIVPDSTLTRGSFRFEHDPDAQETP